MLVGLGLVEFILYLNTRSPHQKIFNNVSLNDKTYYLLEKVDTVSEPEKTLLFVGDSFTRGEQCGNQYNYPGHFQKILDTQKIDLTAVNFGVSGVQTFSYMEIVNNYLKTYKTARGGIVRNKAGKVVEFGRRWIITRLEKGYIIGGPCERLGGGSDTAIMPAVLEQFERVMGEMPKMVVYDRGGDGPKNHLMLEKNKIQDAIFRKGESSLIGFGRNTVLKIRRERALSEAAIATIKHWRYGFNKPSARSSDGCVLKGQVAILGANLSRLTRDWAEAAAIT